MNEIKNYLTGYFTANPDSRVALEKIDDTQWIKLAARELESRATRIISMLPDEELLAIATSQVSLVKAIQEIQH